MAWLKNKTFLITVAALTWNTSTYAASPAIYDFKKATSELRSYCLAEICLGMTIEEVNSHGDLSWFRYAEPSGELSCSDAFQNSASGKLTQRNGATFEISFSLVTTTGDLETRYRLKSIQRKLPTTTEFEIDYLRKMLSDRYAPMKEVIKDQIWAKKTPSGLFEITLMKLWPRPDVDPAMAERAKEISLTARYNHRTEWLMNQAPCKARLPKL